ncbi:MAG: PhnD/SsuA/transferrin family substrate-binding protein [Rhizobiaceae bacterium]|nr:PhnD/SsuA/transferrin family substrate-binding protein [Rhizobiaceae bacterium]
MRIRFCGAHKKVAHLDHPIATLSMYDWPETRPALERFWNLIAKELENAGLPSPKQLNNSEEQMPLWQSPDLIVGQTCGWPYANHLRGTAIPFARFDHGLDECPPGTYRSVFIGQSLADKLYLESPEALAACPMIAINGEDSQSGFHVFSEVAGQQPAALLSHNKLLHTGSHRASILAVAKKEAQIAAIDAVAFELAKKHEPRAVQNISIVGHSRPKPSLPLITSKHYSEDKITLLNAVSRACELLGQKDRNTLCIEQVISAEDKDYLIFRSNG